MRKQIIFLSALTFIFLLVLINANFSISIAENQKQDQITSTITDTTSTVVETSDYIDLTTSIEPVGDNVASIIVIVALLLISPLFAILFLFFGSNFLSTGGTVPGFERGLLLPLLLMTGIFFLILRNRKKK